MAEIYLATPADGSTGQRVAIKVIHPQNATDPDFVRMLIDEAKLAVQLDHPNIVRTYDLGREHDEYYIVMEFIEGADLFKVQQRAAVKGLAFPIALGVYITREVTRALHFAHHLKDADGRLLYIVHRDISPQNVLISFEGEVKITDFGIAKAAYRAEQTQAGIIKGKYYYMSPEQAAGRIIDARTDIFAAGILLYEMLIGEMLYYDDDLDKLLAMVRRAEIVPPSKRRRDIPPALEAIVMKALRKKPEERFQTADEYGTALSEFLREFAPDYSADDLGVFTMRVMDAPRSRSSQAQELTTQISTRSEEEVSPTTGLSSEQLVRLGIHDENSLIFQPAEKLQAMLRAAAAVPEGVRAEQSGAMESRGTDSNIPTRRRVLDRKMEVDPELLESTYPDQDLPGSTREPGAAKPADWSEEMEGVRTNPVWSDRRVTRKHFSRRQRGPIEIGSTSDEVHELPTVSHDAHPPVQAVPVGSSADDEHDAPTAPRPAETAALARISMEIPVLDVAAAKAAYNASASSGPQAQGRPGEPQRSLVFELIPTPMPPEVEMVVSNDGFARVSQDAPPAPEASQSRELTQSDLYTGVGSSIAPKNDLRRSLDLISIESTQENLPPPPPPSSLNTVKSPSGISEHMRSTGQFATATSAIPRSGAPRGRLGYVLSGLGAALVSAILTWQLTIGPRGLHPQTENHSQDAATAGAAGPTLIVYEVPDTEPPPAALSIATEAGSASPKGESPAGENEKPNPKSESEGEGGEIQLTTAPDGVSVYMHRKLVGTTPLTLHDLPLDKDVKLELRLSGYKNKHKRIKWKGESSLAVNIKMKASAGDSKDEGEDEDTDGAGKQSDDSAKDSAKDSDKGKDAPKEPAKDKDAPKEPAKDKDQAPAPAKTKEKEKENDPPKDP